MPQAPGDDGLDADPEPSITESANRAAEPEGHEDDGEDHDHPVDERLPDVEPGQQLGQDDQETRSQHGAEQGGEAAEDDDGDELDGEKEAELLGIEESYQECAQGPRQPRVEGADGEGNGLVLGEIHPHGLRSSLVLADGEECAPGPPADQV